MGSIKNGVVSVLFRLTWISGPAAAAGASVTTEKILSEPQRIFVSTSLRLSR